MESYKIGGTNMSTFEMSPKDYNTLYARFRKGTQPLDFINLAGGVKDKIVIDLCCGDGRLTNLCTPSAKHVYAIDESFEMLDWYKGNKENLTTIAYQVNVALKMIDKVDVVFCQQAINYWLDEKTSKKVSEIMTPGGFFIFNTFNTKPEPIPKAHEYTIDGKEYAEAHWSVNDTVHHVQCCIGYPPHVTEFAWISPYKFRTLLEPYFIVTEIKKGKSSIYCCKRLG
jgi:SAM-dependent methyltransferase